MFEIGAPILRYPPRRGVNPGGICAPRARGTPVSHPAGGPRGVTRVCRGVGVVEFLHCMEPPPTPWHTRVTSHGPPAGCDTDVPRGAGAHIQPGSTPQRCIYSKTPPTLPPLILPPTPPAPAQSNVHDEPCAAHVQNRGAHFAIPTASWCESWRHMRTTSPRHTRVTSRGRPTGCDTGVPWRGGCRISAVHEPPTHTVAHPCHIPRAARGV